MKLRPEDDVDLIDKLARIGLPDILADYGDDTAAAIEHIGGLAIDPKGLMERFNRFREFPVDVETFVLHPAYMNASKDVWPEIIPHLKEINSGKYTETVLTGGIGVAKTTIALYTQAYQTYVLLCMKDPHGEFELDRATEIEIVFQSINAGLAKDVDYTRFRNMIAKAPWFRGKYDPLHVSFLKFNRNIIVKPISGEATAAIGQNVIGGILDEVNFMKVVEKSKKTRDNEVYDQAIKNYNSIAARRKSRFMKMGGFIPGMLCLVSSRNYPGQFTDIKEREALTDKQIHIYDQVLWNLRPHRFGPERFTVFVGDLTRKPRVLNDNEPLHAADRERGLYRAIPTEYRKDFDKDLMGSLREIAGVATMALHPFIVDVESMVACFGIVASVGSRESIDFEATKLQLYPKRFMMPDEPRFAHVDLAFTGDSAGVAVGFVPKFVKMDRGGKVVEHLPLIRYDLLLKIRPPRHGEIQAEDIRRLLYAIREHVPLRWVSFDSYQSRDSLQILHSQGFIVGQTSMDTDPIAYMVAKQAFTDRRIQAPAFPEAVTEWTSLELDRKENKVDHPPNGSKDVADAMAGVAHGLSVRREIWTRHGISASKVPESLRASPQSKRDMQDNVSEGNYIARARAARRAA